MELGVDSVKACVYRVEAGEDPLLEGAAIRQVACHLFTHSLSPRPDYRIGSVRLSSPKCEASFGLGRAPDGKVMTCFLITSQPRQPPKKYTELGRGVENR